MTEEPTASEVIEAPVAAEPVPGTPRQTERAIETFKRDPALLDYIVKQVKGEMAPATQKPAQSEGGVSAAEFEALKMALKYGIPEDKLALIQDTTAEGVRARAELLAASLPKPATSTTEAEPQASTTATKSAGVPLPVATAFTEIPKSRAEILRQLTAQFEADPLPK